MIYSNMEYCQYSYSTLAETELILLVTIVTDDVIRMETENSCENTSLSSFSLFDNGIHVL